jgi:hypothetical protein
LYRPVPVPAQAEAAFVEVKWNRTVTVHVWVVLPLMDVPAGAIAYGPGVDALPDVGPDQVAESTTRPLPKDGVSVRAP